MTKLLLSLGYSMQYQINILNLFMRNQSAKQRHDLTKCLVQKRLITMTQFPYPNIENFCVYRSSVK